MEVEDEIEEEIKDEIEEEIEEEVEDEIDEEIEEELEQELEEEFEQELEEEFEEELEGEFEEELEEEFEEELEGEFEEELDEDYEQELEAEFEDNFDDDIGDSFDSSIEQVFDRAIETQIDDIEQYAATFHDQQGNEIWSEGFLIFTDGPMEQQLLRMGYRVVKREPMTAFGKNLTTVLAPASFSLDTDSEIIEQQLAVLTPLVDVNHVYSLQNGGDGYKPQTLMPKSHFGDSSKVTLGLIDTAIDVNHPALKDANITQRAFVGNGRKQPLNHGTQIAGILMADGDDYQGLLPGSHLLAASVFFEKTGQDSNKGKKIATTESLLKALNWLASEQVKVVNMSLTGPANRLLAFAVERLCQQNIAIVAAVGNAGPLSQPLYPAGYPCTTAVTAVDAKQKIYRRAVIGKHVDIAAYGVDLQTLSAKGSTKTANGTSLATAFVSAYLAASYYANDAKVEDLESWLSGVYQQCQDLGNEGHDNIYGFGLLPNFTFDSQNLKREAEE